jgi:hypothetical protein
MKIQLLVEKKKISKSDVAEAFGMSRKTLNRRINDGVIPPPTGHNNKYTKNDIEKIFEVLGMPSVRPKSKGKRYFQEVMQSNLLIENGGIFLVDENVEYSDMKKHFTDAVNKYGLLDAQGLCNHVHMIECGVSNPVFQLVLTEQIVNRWINLAGALKSRKKALILLSGRVNSEVCIYLVTPKEELLFEKFFCRES